MAREKRDITKGCLSRKILSNKGIFRFDNFIFGLLFLLLPFQVAYGQVIRVAPNGTGDGSSWAQPSSIEDALDNVVANGTIWMQRGTYSINTTLTVSTNGVSIYGGFAGTETALNQRDWVVNPTILDGGETTQIMRIRGSNVLVEGVTFQNGYMNGPITDPTNSSDEPNSGGGALRVYGTTSILRNNKFLQNTSSSARGGGAIFLWHGADHLIENCIFEDNQVIDGGHSPNYGGGAIHSWDNGVVIRNSTFINNSAYNYGGAIYTWTDVMVEDCIFEDNNSDRSGGAIHNNGGDITVNRTRFIGNSSNEDGGAVYGNSISSTLITNSLFDNNLSNSQAGALLINNDTQIANTTFVNNQNHAIVYRSNTLSSYFFHVYNSIFYGNTAQSGASPDISRLGGGVMILI